MNFLREDTKNPRDSQKFLDFLFKPIAKCQLAFNFRLDIIR